MRVERVRQLDIEVRRDVQIALDVAQWVDDEGDAVICVGDQEACVAQLRSWDRLDRVHLSDHEEVTRCRLKQTQFAKVAREGGRVSNDGKGYALHGPLSDHKVDKIPVQIGLPVCGPFELLVSEGRLNYYALIIGQKPKATFGERIALAKQPWQAKAWTTKQTDHDHEQS